MRILREYLGGSEELDLNSEDQYEEFARGIVQNHDEAEQLIARLRVEQAVVVNADNGLYTERYTVLHDPPNTDRERVPLESCVCGRCFFCPDGWHADDEMPCSCTADCALTDTDDDPHDGGQP